MHATQWFLRLWSTGRTYRWGRYRPVGRWVAASSTKAAVPVCARRPDAIGRTHRWALAGKGRPPGRGHDSALGRRRDAV